MKILVTVGTQEQEFKRLFKMIEEVNFPAEYTMQIGSTKYENHQVQVVPYIEDFIGEIAKNDVIITHGGVGSILNSIKAQKKVIVVPRLQKYGEHVNDHQVEISTNYSNKNLIIMVQTPEELKTALNNINEFKPEKFVSNNQMFIEKLEEIIQEIC